MENMLDSTEISNKIRESVPLRFNCANGTQEGVLVNTPFKLPDGDLIDVLVVKRDDRLIVTDVGDTLAWLNSQRYDLVDDNIIKDLINDVCDTLGIEFDKGMLKKVVNDDKDLGDAILNVSQGAMKVADLHYM